LEIGAPLEELEGAPLEGALAAPEGPEAIEGAPVGFDAGLGSSTFREQDADVIASAMASAARGNIGGSG
jgi:hypothetical protein